MGHLTHILLMLTGYALSSAFAYGGFYSGLQNPPSSFVHPTRYGGYPIVYGHKVKHQVPAYLPLSPTFQVEVMKPMAQLEEQKIVKLFVIPQDSLHVFPHAQRLRFPAPVNEFPDLTHLMGDPTHLPAIEIPLQSPMVVGSVESKVSAPAGFTVLFKGPYGAPLQFPIHTGALLAPVPAGTIISAETPVILNKIYAVPSLPAIPSYYPFLVDLPPKLTGPTKGATVIAVTPSPQKVTTTLIPASPSFTVPVDQVSSGDLFTTTVPTGPPTTAVFQQDIQIDNELTGQDPSLVSYPLPALAAGPNRLPFTNSKESPYLQELRDQSIQDLQEQISTLQRRLQQIRSN